MTKLQQLGLTKEDESKLMSMRDYILRLANATSRYVVALYRSRLILILFNFPVSHRALILSLTRARV